MAKKGQISPAKAKLIPSVITAARDAGKARAAAIQTLVDVAGPRPSMALFVAVRVALDTGFIMATLGVDQKEAEAVLNAAGVNAKSVKDGQRQRTEAEEAAYGAARVSRSRLLKAAGVTNPDGRGGDTSKTRKPKPGANKSEAKPATFSKATPKAKSSEDGGAWIAQSRGVLLAYLSKNAKVLTVRQRNALEEAGKALDLD